MLILRNYSLLSFLITVVHRGDTSHSADGVIVLETAKNGGHIAEVSLPAQTLVSKKKKARNLETKNKRLHMHDDDAIELRVTWEESQELLHPPPMNSSTAVKIDNYDFEEYNEPPVFGKKAVFTVGRSGSHIVTGASVIGIKYKGGILMAADMGGCRR